MWNTVSLSKWWGRYDTKIDPTGGNGHANDEVATAGRSLWSRPPSEFCPWPTKVSRRVLNAFPPFSFWPENCQYCNNHKIPLALQFNRKEDPSFIWKQNFITGVCLCDHAQLEWPAESATIFKQTHHIMSETPLWCLLEVKPIRNEHISGRRCNIGGKMSCEGAAVNFTPPVFCRHAWLISVMFCRRVEILRLPAPGGVSHRAGPDLHISRRAS